MPEVDFKLRIIAQSEIASRGGTARAKPPKPKCSVRNKLLATAKIFLKCFHTLDLVLLLPWSPFAPLIAELSAFEDSSTNTIINGRGLRRFYYFLRLRFPATVFNITSGRFCRLGVRTEDRNWIFFCLYDVF